MIHHFASMIAIFVDQVSQGPVVVQCVQKIDPESWTKWLLQFALNIVPVAGGVGIALWSFRATSRKEHEQWIRDQKKAEWKELIKTASEIESVIPVILRIQEGYDSVSKCLPQRVAQLLRVRASCVFLHDILHRQENVKAFSDFIGAAAVAAETLQGFNAKWKPIQASGNSAERSTRKFAMHI